MEGTTDISAMWAGHGTATVIILHDASDFDTSHNDNRQPEDTNSCLISYTSIHPNQPHPLHDRLDGRSTGAVSAEVICIPAIVGSFVRGSTYTRAVIS